METYLGTWQIAPSDGFWTGQSLSDSESLVKYAIQNGIRGFDTAQSYGKGQAEQTLGKILGRYPNENFMVDTKIMPSSKDPYDILKPSLSRLKINSINRLYLHWPRTGFDNASYLTGMKKLKDDGFVKKVGICNITRSGLEKLMDSGVEIDCYQRPVSLLWTRELDDVLAFCRERSIEVVGYSPLGMGLLGGRYRSSSELSDARKNIFCFKEPCYSVFKKMLSVIESIAKDLDVSMADVALGWVAKTGCDVVLLGARNKAQLEANLKGLNIQLTDSQIETLDVISNELSECSKDLCDNIFSYNW